MEIYHQEESIEDFLTVLLTSTDEEKNWHHMQVRISD